jgi:hypothetical protein
MSTQAFAKLPRAADAPSAGAEMPATPASRKPRFNPWRLYAMAAATFAALAAAGYAGGLSPAIARAARVEADRAELVERRQRAAELAAAAAAARADLAATRDALAGLPLRLEPATLVNARLARLTDMASEAHLQVVEIRPGATVEGRDFDAVPIAISGTGSYPACAVYLHRLHAQFPDTHVRAFRATQTEGAGTTFTVELVWHTARRK